MYQDNEILTYDALTDDEINQERGVLSEGIYDFETVECKAGHSQNGNPQATVKQKVYSPDGKVFTLLDWFPMTRNMAWKIKNYWECVGEPDKYNGTFVCNELVGKCGKLKTGVRKDKQDRDQAFVVNYLSGKDLRIHNAQTKGHLQNKVVDELDDDILF